MKIKFALASAALLAAASFRRTAQEVVRPGQEKWTIMLGAFLPAFETEMKVDNDQLGRATTSTSPTTLGSTRTSRAAGSASSGASRRVIGWALPTAASR